jgi:hypothetical protein
MLSKIISLSIRGGVIFGIGFLVGATLHNGLDFRGDIPIITASIIWIAGGIYSLANFNNPYNLSSLKYVENKFSESIDNRNRQKIEEEMLRVKKLLDSEILTEDEYNQKMKSLKEKYL